jgi:hypothetical protein
MVVVKKLIVSILAASLLIVVATGCPSTATTKPTTSGSGR